MGAGIMFMTRGGEVLALRRNDYKGDRWSGHWDFPGGSSEQGESRYETAIRESFEETGNPTHFKVVDHFKNGDHYTLFLALVPKAFKPILSEEHSSWAWFKPLELLEKKMHPKDKKPLLIYLSRSGKHFATPPKPYSPPKG